MRAAGTQLPLSRRKRPVYDAARSAMAGCAATGVARSGGLIVSHPWAQPQAPGAGQRGAGL